MNQRDILLSQKILMSTIFSFYLMPFFWSIRIVCPWLSCRVFFWALVDPDSFQTFRLWRPWVLRSVGQRHIDAPLLELLVVFFWLHWSDRFWGRKTTVVKCHFHRVLLKVHPGNAIDHCWCWPLVMGQSSVSRYVHSEGTLLSLFPHCHLWKNPLCIDHC